MATTSTHRPGGPAWWPPAMGGACLVGGLLVGVALRGGGEALRLLLVGLAALPRLASPPWARRSRRRLLGAVVAFPLAVALHNVVSAWLGVEEPVFFLIALVAAPLAFVVGALGAAVSALLVLAGPARG